MFLKFSLMCLALLAFAGVKDHEPGQGEEPVELRPPGGDAQRQHDEEDDPVARGIIATIKVNQ